MILRYEQITADHLGNITDTRDLCEWYYDADGTLAKEEKSVYDLKRNGEKVIENYFCVEYTYNNGKLVSSNYTEKEYNITSSMFEGVTGSWLSSVYTSTRTYTLDEKGRVTQEIEIPGDTVYYTYQGGILQTNQPSVASYTYKTYYGDYYVYTPAEK